MLQVLVILPKQFLKTRIENCLLLRYTHCIIICLCFNLLIESSVILVSKCTLWEGVDRDLFKTIVIDEYFSLI